MKLNRLVKAFLVQFNNGDGWLCRQFDGGSWDLLLDDCCTITAAESYDLAKDIFEREVAKEITKITFFINDEPRFTVNRNITREEFLCQLIGDRPISELFS